MKYVKCTSSLAMFDIRHVVLSGLGKDYILEQGAKVLKTRGKDVDKKRKEKKKKICIEETGLESSKKPRP